MRGASIVLQAVLIFAIALAAIFIVIPWSMQRVDQTPEISEPGIVLDQLRTCNQKITDTARTGNGNTCLFSIDAGKLDVMQDGIYYILSSEAENLCDQHVETTIDSANHITQKCTTYLKLKTLQYKWFWPVQITIIGSGFNGTIGGFPINFTGDANFTTLTVYVKFAYDAGQRGDTLDIVRESIAADNVVIKAVLR